MRISVRLVPECCSTMILLKPGANKYIHPSNSCTCLSVFRWQGSAGACPSSNQYRNGPNSFSSSLLTGIKCDEFLTFVSLKYQNVSAKTNFALENLVKAFKVCKILKAKCKFSHLRLVLLYPRSTTPAIRHPNSFLHFYHVAQI